MTNDWESRVRKLENEGLTRSDAQAVVDAEDMRTNETKLTPNYGVHSNAIEIMADLGIDRDFARESQIWKEFLDAVEAQAKAEGRP